MPYVHMLAVLDDPRFAQDAVHHALEALDRTGVYAWREHHTPEPMLGWIDGTFGGVWSSEAAVGGAWIARGAAGTVGFAAFDPRGLRYGWLRAATPDPSIGTFGPFGVAEEARRRGIGTVLLHAALFALRERGYRSALIPAVAASSDLPAFYARHANARVVAHLSLDRSDRRFRTTVLASGNGSNFQAIVDTAARGTIPLDVTALVCNRSNAFALERARSAGIASHVVAWDRAGESRAAYDRRVLDAVAATEPDLVLLLGWMHVLPAAFVVRFPELVNLHPAFLPLDPAAGTVTMPDGSALPAFRGAHAFDDALAAGAGWSGVTVHRVTAEIDRGAVLARAPLRVHAGRSRAELDDDVHALERRVLVTALRRWTWEAA